MKKILLSITAVVAAISVNAQTTVYSEDFSGVANWTPEQAWQVADVVGDGKTWGFYNFAGATTLPAEFQALGIVAGSNSWDTVALTPDNFFISPAVDLTGFTSASLSFTIGALDPDWPAENYSVYVVTDVAQVATATPVLTETIATGGVLAVKTADISAVAGSATATIVVRHHACTDQYILVFDNVVVTAGTGAGNVNSLTFEASVFPNPASDVLNINTNGVEVASIAIYSLDGKVVATGNGTSVNVASLTEGMYIYEVVATNGAVSKNTFVKK
jgi:hypothetical protein